LSNNDAKTQRREIVAKTQRGPPLRLLDVVVVVVLGAWAQDALVAFAREKR